MATALLCAGYAAALALLGILLAAIPVVGQLALWFAAVPWLRGALGLGHVQQLAVVDVLALVVSLFLSTGFIAAASKSD